jgi:tetrahydromethanopterin S-methyltransferase subunit E
MGLGTGIALIVLGLILALAVRDSWDVVDLTAIGWICAAAGVLAIILTLVMSNQRRNTTHREVVERYDDRTPPAPPVV